MSRKEKKSVILSLTGAFVLMLVYFVFLVPDWPDVEAATESYTYHPTIETADPSLPTPAPAEDTMTPSERCKDYINNSENVEKSSDNLSEQDKEIANEWKAIDIAIEMSATYHISWQVVVGLMNQESNFNQGATGPDGLDHGICQIRETNYSWLEELSGKELDPVNSMRDNIECSFIMLKWIKDSYPEATTWNTRLMIYNGGYTYASNLWNDKVYSTEYSTNIMDYAKKIHYKEK